MAATIPKYNELFLSTLLAVQSLGGSGSIPEIVAAVIRIEGLSEEQQTVLHNEGPETEIGYRVAWARSYLKAFAFLENSARGVWALTEAGTHFLADNTCTREQLDEQLQGMKASHIKSQRVERAASGEAQVERSEDQEAPEQGGVEAPTATHWKERLIATLRSPEFSDKQFERLSMRLLRESGIDDLQVTGGSNDGGIDGVGTYRLGLLSFAVFFQCKKYANHSVTPHDVRDFRGAMQGRGDHGLLLTTSTFTAKAQAEAVRPGATAIDLVDGNRLCELLKQYDLGVKTEKVEKVTVSTEFFADM